MSDEPSVDGELAALCQACGLCCDGSLFGRVGLQPAEVASAKRHRLRVVASETAFSQPCPALTELVRDRGHDAGDPRGCAIYDERPLACRAFACRLYDRHRREGGPLEPRLAAARRVRALLVELDASGQSAADFAEGAGTDAFRELVTRLDEDFARA